VLFMDDEEIVRTVAGEMIGLLGAEAAFAGHGEEALALYRKAREERRPFDGVVLDLTIRGGMGGLETLAGLLEIDPGVKAIVSSGYSDDGAVADHLRHGFRGVLRKPYNLTQLQDALARLIGPAP
jgi:CheY-like chemotaxis protein